MSGSALADYAAGLAAYSSGDFASALRQWRPAAEHGDARAQHGLGILYETGQGVQKVDYREAVRWYGKAAARGLPAAQSNLGLMFAEGRGVSRDLGRAVDLWRQAATAGHPMAQFNLGLTYYRDISPPDYAEAAKWFTRAARNNVVDAQYALAEMYRIGRGVPRNLAEARSWFAKAAARGNADAARRLKALGGESAGASPAASAASPTPQTGSADTSAAGAAPMAAEKPPVPVKPVTASATPEGGVPSQASADSGSHAALSKADARELRAPPTTGAGSADTARSGGSPPTDSPSPGTIRIATPVAESAGAAAYRVWLTSLRSAALAQASWRDLTSRYPDLLGALALSVRRVDLGGDMGVWYRVLGGPLDSREAARSLCAEIRKRSPNEDCMVVAN